jgi:hypothetical protein
LLPESRDLSTTCVPLPRQHKPIMRLLLPLAFCFVAAAKFHESGRRDAFGSIDSFQGFNTGLKLARDGFLEPRLPTGACDASTPCVNGACCSVSGFCGYSPAFCGSGNCTSNCNAKAECGEYAVEGEQDCPLNVCCSQFGYALPKLILIVQYH